jgi:Bardet-Biedl syndrome 1 protein
MLVLGTEAGQVHILEPSASTVAHTFQLPSAPAFIVASGLKAVEYRVICACRDGRIYTIKNGELTGTVIEMESLPCALARIDKSIYVACTTSVVHAFSLKGRRQFTLFLPSPALCMDVVEQTRPRNVRALLLGLANGELRLYADKSLISTVQLGEPVAALRFGCYGREDGALVVVGASGALSIKMLHRKANLETPSAPPGPPREQDIPLSIPKKTKLYVEHTQREREIAIDMHRVFQRDLCKLRLSTARAYVKLLSDGRGQVSFSPSASLRLTAQVQGLGPRFCIKLTLQNTGRQAAHNLGLSLHHDANILKLESAARRLPVLVPGISLRLELRVQRLKEAAGSDEIRVLVNSPASALPLMSAIVSIPASEKLLR